MNKEDWEKGISAWENVKKQAEMDKEQAELYISAIKQKLKDIEVN